MNQISLDTLDPGKVYELDLTAHEDLTRQVKLCVEARFRLKETLLKFFNPHPDPKHEVSGEALEMMKQEKNKIDSVSGSRKLSNVIAFHFGNVEGSVSRKDLLKERIRLDKLVWSVIQEQFEFPHDFSMLNTGNFWYPGGAYMGWHTNENAPGWRLYISYCAEPGKSFFRYQNSETGEMVTLWDKEWNFRLFKVSAEKPIWHSVYSETDRFSFGYLINAKAQIKGRYKSMYDAGYESCKPEDCLQGYDWLSRHYSEEYNTMFHRLRALSTTHPLLWKMARKAEEGQVVYRMKRIFHFAGSEKAGK